MDSTSENSYLRASDREQAVNKSGTCELTGCDSEATKIVEVKDEVFNDFTGEQKITIEVCKKCSEYFREGKSK